jgi:ferritin
MIGKKMAEALNGQMNAEFYNSRLYLSMATYFHSINVDGAMKWMEAQASEETGHAMKLYEHLKERNARLLLSAIDAPPTEWNSPLAAFEAAYEHECNVSARFDELMALAAQEKDHATAGVLQWFVNEQVEEVASTDAVVQRLKMAQNAPGGLFMVDRLLAERE